jgi:predicted HAD superfamily phosphohydrolase YqeG
MVTILKAMTDCPLVGTFVFMGAGHFTTLRQSLPRLGHLLSQLQPTYHLDTVAEIDAAFLIELSIDAVLWDVDGTLMTYHGDEVDNRFSHIRNLFRNGPARHAILSNCDETRYETLSELFPEVHILRGYITADGLVYRHRLEGRDTHTGYEVNSILSNGGSQIRKPSRELIEYGRQVLEVDDPHSVLMVGDQYLTDIASANLAGVRSVKVRTFGPDTFPRPIRLSQRLENLLYAALYRHRR